MPAGKSIGARPRLSCCTVISHSDEQSVAVSLVVAESVLVKHQQAQKKNGQIAHRTILPTSWNRQIAQEFRNSSCTRGPASGMRAAPYCSCCSLERAIIMAFDLVARPYRRFFMLDSLVGYLNRPRQTDSSCGQTACEPGKPSFAIWRPDQDGETTS